MDNQSKSPLRGAIVAMTQDRVIGIDGGMPWHHSADMRRFKTRTLNHTVVMGRLTWESMGNRALPQRRNIVISRSPVADVEHYTSVEDALNVCQQDDVWIIGGGQIYRAAFSYLNLLDVTFVPDKVETPNAITFPEIDPNIWVVTEESVVQEDPLLVNHIYQRN